MTEAPTPGAVSSTFGAIVKIEGSRFTIKIEAGTEIQVDAEKALKDGISPTLVVGQSVSVYGNADAHGVVHADVIRPEHKPKKR